MKLRMHSQVLSLSSKYGDKRTYVWAKAERTCVLLAIGVLSHVIKLQRQKDLCMGKKPNRTLI